MGAMKRFEISGSSFAVLLSLSLAVGAGAGLGIFRTGDSRTSILNNGNFEKKDRADKTKPAFWEKPDGLGVQWVRAPEGRGRRAHGKVIRIDTKVTEKAMVAQWQEVGLTQWIFPNPADNAIAATYGLSYYSDPMPVTTGFAYRVTFDYMGASGGAKVWVRGYGPFRGEKRRRYETMVNCRTEAEGWNHFSQVFHPTKLRPKVNEMKVMLYAYWPPGIYLFDNVKVEPITLKEYKEARDLWPKRDECGVRPGQ